MITFDVQKRAVSAIHLRTAGVRLENSEVVEVPLSLDCGVREATPTTYLTRFISISNGDPMSMIDLRCGLGYRTHNFVAFAVSVPYNSNWHWSSPEFKIDPWAN